MFRGNGESIQFHELSGFIRSAGDEEAAATPSNAFEGAFHGLFAAAVVARVNESQCRVRAEYEDGARE